jgi:hypothetical protein
MTPRGARRAAWLALAGVAACATPRREPSATPQPVAIAAAAPTPEPNPAPPPPPRGTTREVTLGELRALDPLMRTAERVRELRFVRPVPVFVQDAEAIAGFLDAEIDQKDVEHAHAVYGALGLVDRALDLRALWSRLMTEQVVGYYDLEHGRLVVRDDVIRALALDAPRGGERDATLLQRATEVLVHELVHALQAQHLGLAALMEQPRDADADNALRALVEGDATLAMVAHTLERDSLPLSYVTRDPARVRRDAARAAAPIKGSVLDSAPAIVRVPLRAAYVDGLVLAAALHGAGGFARLNRAYAEPPASSEQVLHPERYGRSEPPERVRVPQASDLLGPGFHLVAEDTLGELELSVYFAQSLADRAAYRAAEGWAGDRLYVFRSEPDALAAVWVTTWDDERHAIEAERAAAKVETRPAAAGTLGAGSHVERLGRALLILRNVPADRRSQVRDRLAAWLGRDKPALAILSD